MSYAKPCKYNCGTQIVWDKFANQFKDNQTGEPHTREVCESIRNQKGGSTYKITSPQQQIPISTKSPAFDHVPQPQQALNKDNEFTNAALDIVVRTQKEMNVKIDNLNIAIAKVMSIIEQQNQNNPTVRDNMILKQKVTELEEVIKKNAIGFIPANQVPQQNEVQQGKEYDQHVRDMVKKGEQAAEEELDLT